MTRGAHLGNDLALAVSDWSCIRGVGSFLVATVVHLVSVVHPSNGVGSAMTKADRQAFYLGVALASTWVVGMAGSW